MHKIYIIEIIFVLIIFPTNCEILSGFYIDDGFNRTNIVKIDSNIQKEYIEHKLLNILDLPNKPRIRGSLRVKKSASTFLLSIYKNISTSDSESNQEDMDEYNLSNDIINIIGQSNLIMTFSAQNTHLGNSSKIKHSKKLWFDVSEILEIESIMATELRLYQELNKNVKSNKAYNITAYRIAKEKNGRQIKHYINSVKTAINKGGWISLNISQAFEHWIKFPKENRGLSLAVYTDHKNIMTLKDIGIVDLSGIPEKQPFAVMFFKTFIVNHGETHETLIRQTRSIEFKKQHYNQNNEHTPTRYRCKLNSLYINFEDHQWQDWIIAPTRYNAHYCSGGCSFPIISDVTNHAIIQSIAHIKISNKVPNPNCAPTKLSPISVLYFVNDNKIALKKLTNMIVNSCGCQ
ncbi:Protein 60A [Melipona quadrifasciata]|uniref:Protein 60A n=1 Tax=Melipona quadrifasciata TaxID=166423 RepID=A0A0N0BC65_9HYME|nr:Protein 60A [Melipona quadrifasciata]